MHITIINIENDTCAAPAAIDDFNVDIQNNSVSDNQNNPRLVFSVRAVRASYRYARPKAY